MTILSATREEDGDALKAPAAFPVPATPSAFREGTVAALLASGWMIGLDHPSNPAHIWALAAVFLAVVLLAAQSSNRSLISRLWLAIVHVGFVALLLLTTDQALARWEERGPRIDKLSNVCAFLLDFLGYRASAERGVLLIDHPDGLVKMVLSPEKLAVEPFLLFWVSWVVLRAIRGGFRDIGKPVFGLIVSMAFSLARFMVVLMVYVEHDKILVGDEGQAALDLLGSPWTIAPTLLIAGLCLDRIVRNWPRMELPPRPARRRRQTLAASFAMLGLGCLVGLAGSFMPPGSEKAGRILIDDRFCGVWEPTARQLDTRWFGDFSTYSFTSLAEWLGKWFSVDVNIDKSYDDELLSRYDVLIIKTPEEPIPDRETEAIDRFVHRGGGLLLVGDHTNLLGMGTHLNALSARYGIRFRYDSVSDGATGGFVNYFGPPIGRHVGALHVDHFEFMTSCSLHLSGTAETILAVDGCRREPHDYASSSFFGRHGPHPELEHGRTVLAATVRVGRGQIAAFTDSTVWSSFAVFENDRDELAMDLVRLLNREASLYELPLRVAATAALAITLAVLLIRLASPALVMFCSLLGFWSGIAASESLHRWAHAWPPSNSPVDEVSFVWKGGACAFPPVLGSPGSLPADVSFDTLLVSVQRLGLVPQVAYSYEDILRTQTRAVFVVSPVEVPPARVIERLKKYVRDGGHLVVMDDYRQGEKGSAKEFLAAFDATIAYHASGDEGGNNRPHVHLGGGMIQIQVPAPDAFVARKPFGRGQVVYLSDAINFSREGLGHCFARPWKAAEDRYRTIFLLLSDVLHIAPTDRRFYTIIR